MKHILVISALIALSGTASAQQDRKPTPYSTSTQQLMQEQQGKSADLSAKLAAEKRKRAACRTEARTQKVSLMKRRAYVRDCVKR
jgi:hypothetical protein